MSYLDRCQITKVFNPNQAYKITGKCVMTGQEHSVEVPAQEFYDYTHGKLAQEAMSSVSADDREFLISGTSPQGWKRLFGDGDED